MKYHEKLRFLNKSYFNKIYIVLVLSFTYMAFDIFMQSKLIMLNQLKLIHNKLFRIWRRRYEPMQLYLCAGFLLPA